jgi:RND family efflux transporter MFP subunit
VANEALTKLKIDRSGGEGDKMRFEPESRSGVSRVLWALALAIAAGAYYWQRDESVEVKTFAVATAYPSQTITLFNATGYVAPQSKADVASKAAGRLEKLEVEEGMRVDRNQVLARIENRDLVAGMNQALANLEVARANVKTAEVELHVSNLSLGRATSLLSKKFSSQDTVDQETGRRDKALAALNSARAAVGAAEAAYRAAEIAVDYTLIRAPFDGVILKKNADVGDVLSPFSPASQSKGAVFSMADMNTLEVEADVSESSLLQVKLDQPCEIQLDALPEMRLRGMVKHIVPTVDRTKATVMVKVAFADKDERILPDMSAKVAFLSRELKESERTPVTVVKAAAIVGGHAFLAKDGVAKRVEVETGEKIDEMLVVRKGLAVGDEAILSPPEDLVDGAKIRLAAAK